MDILFVADADADRRRAIALLQGSGHRVVATGRREEAVDLVGRYRFDVVLIDVALQAADCFGTALAIRRGERNRRAHVPVVAMTPYADDRHRARCLDVGIDACVSKPIAATELSAIVEQLTATERSDRDGKSRQTVSPWVPADLAVAPGVDDVARAVPVVRRATGVRRFGGSAKRVPLVIGHRAADHRAQMIVIRDALARRDVGAVRLAASSLRAGLPFYGAPRIVELACRLEAMAANGDLSGGHALYAALSAEIDGVRPALTELTRA